MVTAVGATPIAEGESVTWLFNMTDLLGSDIQSIKYWVYIDAADPVANDESIETRWYDEFGTSALTDPEVRYGPKAGYYMTSENFVSSWTADLDLYHTITSLVGTVDIEKILLEGVKLTNDEFVHLGYQTGKVVSSVPDASIILLLGSSLMGLAVFSRKSKRTG
jgi:hypothetical protein